VCQARRMFSRVVRLRNAHGLTRFVAVALALAGFAAVVGVIVAVGTAGSYRDAIAGAMWLIGFLAALYVAGQLLGEILAWGLDEESERDKPQWALPLWSLLPAGLVVMVIGTVVYVL
jgi:hypothetical protein